MHGGTLIAALLPTILALAPSPAASSDAQVWFEQAVRHDEEGDAKLAYAQYRRAADAGLSQAQFNVAAMLDSGRGVGRDLAQAATWYARAAARGNARAAYNLGQLYQDGVGVPRNIDLARAWFAASGLGAARARIATLPTLPPSKNSLSAPILIAPGNDTSTAGRETNGIELVWTSGPQPEPVSYFVELCAINAGGTREIFSTFVATTSVLAPVSITGGTYAWRVSSVARKSSRYAASPWLTFTAGLP